MPGKMGIGKSYAQKAGKIFYGRNRTWTQTPKRGEKNEKRRGLRQRFCADCTKGRLRREKRGVP